MNPRTIVVRGKRAEEQDMAPKAAAKETGTVGIAVDRLGTTQMLVPIVGTAPLIVHRWSEKAKKQMLDAQQGKRAVKQHKDPEQDYQDSLYRTENGFGFPVLAFKAATVGAARFYGKDVSMVMLRMAMYWDGVPSADRSQLLVPIEGEPKSREDMVRLSMSSTDIRYRGEFLDWSAVLSVRFVSTALSQDSVLALIEAGGMAIGVGEWRPEKDGINGTYAIDQSRDIVIGE